MPLPDSDPWSQKHNMMVSIHSSLPPFLRSSRWYPHILLLSCIQFWEDLKAMMYRKRRNSSQGRGAGPYSSLWRPSPGQALAGHIRQAGPLLSSALDSGVVPVALRHCMGCL